MSDEYQKLILDKVRAEINRWIDELIEKHGDLMLTRQWQVLFPKGFKAGHCLLPVITSSKHGKHLVGNVEFVLPDDLHLDIDNMKLSLKDEPFQPEPGLNQVARPIAIDEPLYLLNRIVLGVNDFIKSITLAMPMGIGPQLNLFKTEASPIGSKSGGSGSGNILVSRPAGNEDIDKTRREMLSSPHLPDWLKSISNKQVYDELIDKLVSAYVQYQRSSGGQSSIKDFFEKYTSHMLSHGHLHHWCKYKGKPVELDERQFCTDAFCSKKLYNSSCPLVVLKFGKE